MQNPKLITRKVDKRQLINTLRATTNTYVDIIVDVNNSNYITIKDNYNINQMRTKN